MSKVVIHGDGFWADLAHLYLSQDSPHEVVAFSDEGHSLKSPRHRGLPVVPFEELPITYPAEDYSLFLPLGYRKMNHVRAAKVEQARSWGYALVSYVSSRARLWPGFVCGENCFIIEGNTLQPFTTLGDDVLLWIGNHLGPRCIVKDHVTITSQVVLSGNCVVEPYCFIGPEATVRDGAVLARETRVEAGAVVLSNTKEGDVVRARASRMAETPGRLRLL